MGAAGSGGQYIPWPVLLPQPSLAWSSKPWPVGAAIGRSCRRCRKTKRCKVTKLRQTEEPYANTIKVMSVQTEEPYANTIKVALSDVLREWGVPTNTAATLKPKINIGSSKFSSSVLKKQVDEIYLYAAEGEYSPSSARS
ncbi:hypothetical protein UY3_03360 [Chelonia mydas]|uniref:Uncharacterized protein n=1 Tax=Chelonia mydas TaxID=8469 RepID=M7BQD1_CHEMY|nr:hypothetical protein UY3_03360 [Chelonia mydas]